MEILITGTSGFLGSRAAEYFREQGWQVHAPTHAQLDITDDASVGAWFSQHHPQAVIHCAAVSDTGACQKDPDRTAKINVEGPARLARVCGESGKLLPLSRFACVLTSTRFFSISSSRTSCFG